MLRELSEDVRILLKDRLRDLRSIVRQHRHDNPAALKPSASRSGAQDAQPFPVREIEGLLGHAVSAFDDAMTFAERFAPPGSARRIFAPQPLQAYFRAQSEDRLDGARAFRRDLYQLAKLFLEQQKLAGFAIREGDFATAHAALLKHDAAGIARLHGNIDPDERVALVALLCASLLVELVREQPIRLEASQHAAPDMAVAVDCLAAIAIASGLATLDMEGAPGHELMEVATLAVDVRKQRIHAALESQDPVDALAALFAGLLTHLN